MSSPTYAMATTAVVADANAELETVAHTPFSHDAFVALKDAVADYVSRLVTDAARTARRHGSDAVSQADVVRASHFLATARAGRVLRTMGTLGGVFFGASVSKLFDVLNGQQFTPAAVLIAAALGITGAFLMALTFSRD